MSRNYLMTAILPTVPEDTETRARILDVLGDFWEESQITDPFSDNGLLAEGDQTLGGGETEDQFFTRLRNAIWTAAGEFVAVELTSIDLTTAPCDYFETTVNEYKQWRATCTKSCST